MSDPQPILERLLRLHPKLVDLSLDRVRRLLAALDDPHTKLPPVVHVAGTNGKGSVIAMMRAILETAGYRVHVYTSPHLVRFNERIRLAGRVIDDEGLSTLLDECEDANGGEEITFFEITTAAAFLAFSRQPADVLLLETGLGGRLDATNAVIRPILSVITPVDIDHQQYLGVTLGEIATEKAGILKKDVPCVLARQWPEAMDAITAKAAEVGAPLVVEDLDWTLRYGLETMVVNTAGEILELPRPALEGPHQVHNAGVALAALRRLPQFEITKDHVRRGLANIDWPARLQRIRRGRVRAQLGQHFALWLDGGHNGAAGETLAAWLAERPRMPLHLVLGMLKTKDPVAFLDPLQPYLHSLRTVDIEGQETAFGDADLADLVTAAGFPATPATNVRQALRDINREEDSPARVLIAGSLYLAGLVLAESGWNTLESPQAQSGGTP